MAEKTIEEELDLETNPEENINKNKVEERIKDLNSKIILTAKERDKLSEDNKNLAKERDFFSSFADITSTYPQAKDFKDKIKEKVMAGYTVEDAAISVLNKEGKLVKTEAPVIEKVNPAGGSAVNPIPQNGQKSISEMTREEKRQALIDAEKRGDISLS